MKQLTEEEFEEKFTVEVNHVTGDEAFGGMFGTSREELEYVMHMNAISNRVWTIVEAEGSFSFTSGVHVVNRYGYLITKEERDQDYEVILPFEGTSYVRGALFVENWGIDAVPAVIELEIEDYLKGLILNAVEYAKNNEHVNSVMISMIGTTSFLDEEGDEDEEEYEYFENFLKSPELRIFGDGTVQFISENRHDTSARIYTVGFNIHELDSAMLDLN